MFFGYPFAAARIIAQPSSRSVRKTGRQRTQERIQETIILIRRQNVTRAFRRFEHGWPEIVHRLERQLHQVVFRLALHPCPHEPSFSELSVPARDVTKVMFRIERGKRFRERKCKRIGDLVVVVLLHAKRRNAQTEQTGIIAFQLIDQRRDVVKVPG